MGGDSAPAPDFASKAAMYDWLTKQSETYVDGLSKKFTPQANLVIGLGNVAALCFYELNRFANPTAPVQSLPVNWFGFYLLQAPGILGLGPFQGRPACTEIRIGRGVCGTAADAAKTLVVSNVHDFPGHIACDSASESEVVVPIVSENGSVLGVIDVDSTVVNHFDEEDGRGLERVAAVLAKHLEFPMARALAVNPSLAFPTAISEANPGGPLPVAIPSHASPELPPPPPTRVTGLAAMTIEVVKPETAVELVSGWEFYTTRLARTMNQKELQEMEATIGISAFPEIQFPFNTVRIAPEASREHPILCFDLLSILRNAGGFYQTEDYKQVVAPQLSIPVSESWASVQYDRYDPKVDWAWRHRYFGIPPASSLQPLQPDMPSINWDLLKDQTLPIVFFDKMDFMEDDLHDHGMVRGSLKLRVMEAAFFVLFRHLVRVDHFAFWIRDVRYYHEFGVTHPTADGGSEPHIVVVEQTSRMMINEAENAEWKDWSEDEIAAKATVLEKVEYYVKDVVSTAAPQ